MGIYSRSPSRARRKRRTKYVRKPSRAPRKKRKAIEKKKKTARPKARAAKRTKRVVKKATSRKKVAKKAAARKAKPTRAPVKKAKRKRPTRAAVEKENRRLRAELQEIRGSEQKTTRKKPESRAKRGIRKRKRGVERARIEQVFAAHEYPLATPEEALKARNRDWAEKKKQFRELLDKARATGQLPKPERVKRRIDTARSRGEQTVVRLRRRVTVNNIADLLYKVDAKARERLSGRFPTWLMKLTLSSMGEKLIGSGNRLLILRQKNQAAETFYVQSYDSTGAWNSLVGALGQLEGMLDEYASLRRNVVYVHSIKVSNFERK